MKTQLIIAIVCIFVLLVFVVVMYTKKDAYVYYPFRGEFSATPPPQNKNVDDFFTATDSPVDDSLNTELYKSACNNCDTSNRMLKSMTPRACELCKSYVSGHMLKFRSMGIL